MPLGAELLDFNKSFSRALALSPVQTLLDCVSQQMEELERLRSAQPTSGRSSAFESIRVPTGEFTSTSASRSATATSLSSHSALQDRALGQQIYCYVLTRLLPDRELDAIDVAASEDPFSAATSKSGSGTQLVEYVALLLTETDCLLLRLCSCLPPTTDRKRSRSQFKALKKKLSHVASSAVLRSKKGSTVSLASLIGGESSSLGKSVPDNFEEKNEAAPSPFPMLLLQSSLRLFEFFIFHEIEVVVRYVYFILELFSSALE